MGQSSQELLLGSPTQVQGCKHLGRPRLFPRPQAGSWTGSGAGSQDFAQMGLHPAVLQLSLSARRHPSLLEGSSLRSADVAAALTHE